MHYFSIPSIGENNCCQSHFSLLAVRELDYLLAGGKLTRKDELEDLHVTPVERNITFLRVGLGLAMIIGCSSVAVSYQMLGTVVPLAGNGCGSYLSLLLSMESLRRFSRASLCWHMTGLVRRRLIARFFRHISHHQIPCFVIWGFFANKSLFRKRRCEFPGFETFVERYLMWNR